MIKVSLTRELIQHWENPKVPPCPDTLRWFFMVDLSASNYFNEQALISDFISKSLMSSVSFGKSHFERFACKPANSRALDTAAPAPLTFPRASTRNETMKEFTNDLQTQEQQTVDLTTALGGETMLQLRSRLTGTVHSIIKPIITGKFEQYRSV